MRKERKEHALDRLERTLLRCCEKMQRDAIRSRASREQQTKTLKAYAEAVKEYDIATATLEHYPEDLTAREKLLEAKEILNQAQEAVKATLRH